MKILILFLDMVRANRLHINNENIEKTPLDKFLIKFGGTNYTNCFSQAPDTGRGIGVFLSGLSPSSNGCDNRVKYPRFFLNSSKTIFDIFLDQNYQSSYYLYQHHILPEKLMKYNSFIEKPLKTFCENLKLNEKHVVFMDIPTYHSVLDNFGYSVHGELLANKKLVQNLELIFQFLNKDEFDDIYIFSDHGFKFGYEMLYQKIFNKQYLLLNEDRTNILMFHRNKNDTNLKNSNNLMGLDNLYYMIESNLYSENSKITHRKYIVIEDHLHFTQNFDNIQIWALILKNIIYIRTFRQAFIIERNSSKLLSTHISNNYDDMIATESNSFQEVLNILKSKKTKNSKNLCVDTALKCISKNKIIKKLDVIRDFIKFMINKYLIISWI